MDIYFDTERMDYEEAELINSIFPEAEAIHYKNCDFIVSRREIDAEPTIEQLMEVSRHFQVVLRGDCGVEIKST